MERIGRAHWPVFVRGDRDWGTQANMTRAEQERLDYVFKLRLTRGVKKLVERLMRGVDWCDAGQGWQGAEAPLRLSGWSSHRRAVVLRRPMTRPLAVVDQSDPTQLRLSFTEVTDEVTVYEYAVLVTSLEDKILTIAQHYRDRADCENSFDELKNHWGWGGFTTHDLKRCRFMARMTALVYDWWSLFVRLADPHQHTESMTSCPLLLHAPARLTRHGRQTCVTISHVHADAPWVERACRNLSAFFQELRTTAEQLSSAEKWRRVLSRALVKYLRGRLLHPPALLPEPG